MPEPYFVNLLAGLCGDVSEYLIASRATLCGDVSEYFNRVASNLLPNRRSGFPGA